MDTNAHSFLGSATDEAALLQSRTSLLEQIGHLTSFKPPASFNSEPNPVVGDTAVESPPNSEQNPEKSYLRNFIILMLVSGALFDFLSKTIYQLLPGKDGGLQGLDRNKWATWALTMGSLLATAVPPTLQKKNRDALRGMTTNFAIKLVAPSVMDLLVTVTRLAAIVYMPPSVVAIVKISVNIAVLAFINVCRGKPLLRKQWFALLGCFVGLILVFMEDVAFPKDDNEETGGRSKQIAGLGLSVLCGVLGGFRNTVEEVILQGDNFPDGALLMVESWGSCLLMIPIYGVLYSINTPDDPGASGLLKDPAIVILLFFFAITSWGKDAGKLKVTKYGSAILVKVIALLFPFGTWVLSLTAYRLSTERVGEDWTVQSFLRLAGFLVILSFAYMFSSAKKPAAPAKNMPSQVGTSMRPVVPQQP